MCWSVRGGAGVSVVSAALAVAARAEALLVDLDGALPTLLGIDEPEGPGLAEWMAAPAEVPADALARLEVPVAPGLSLLPRGHAPLDGARVPVLVDLLGADPRAVVVDAGRLDAAEVRLAFARAADRSIVVCPSCPLALRHHAELDPAPSAAIVVRGSRRALGWRAVGERLGVPVLAELRTDPAVGAAVDAGLRAKPFPRSFLKALEGIA